MKHVKTLRNKVFEYVKEKYGSDIEYPWMRYPDYAVFRHNDNKKWYGLVMNIPRNRLGLSGEENIDILNIKLDDILYRDLLLKQDGFFPGYHISRGNWISVSLDGTVDFSEISSLIDRSYAVTASTASRQKIRAPKQWIVPANPKYYDIEHAFDYDDVINWKQGRGIRKGDTVYMYVAAPVSAVLYKCEVIKTDIPYYFTDGKLTLNALMAVRIVRRYSPDVFPFDRLKDEFGIYAVRGPRGVPSAFIKAAQDE
jgi:predicted DNA-binding protein (MmcQ/YjbR family)